jgi:hypothetical protein
MKELFNFILKKVGIPLARPTTVKYHGGEIIFKNIPKEVIEGVKAHLQGPVEAPPQLEPTVTPPVATISAATPASDAPLLCTSLGVYQNPLTLNWHMCELKYSPFSKKGVVESDLPVSRDKYECDERFKIQSVHLGLIG